MGNRADELRSDFLFARPSFIEGLARMLDLSGSLNTYNNSRTPEEADARAVRNDWKAIGHDMRQALDELRSEAGEPR